MENISQIITGAAIFTENGILENHMLLIRDDKIAAILPENPDIPEHLQYRCPAHSLIAPGFIDLQVNGAGGILFNDQPDLQAIRHIGKTLEASGTTGFLPTLITDSRDKMLQACEAAVAALRESDSTITGLHLEGPFISPQRPGIHDPKFIRIPDEDDLRLLESTAERMENGRLMLTIAPETVPAEIIAHLCAAGIRISIGHTAANYDLVQQALIAGAHGFTHLFNAMPPLINREPGPVGAALENRRAFCSIVADGIHVHPSLLKTTYHAREKGSLCLISDAMPPVGTDKDSFMLYGQKILRRNGRLESEDGILAGADMTLEDALKNCIGKFGIPVEEALRMASLYPARFLNMAHRSGKIVPGFQADLVLLSHWRNISEFAVTALWKNGNLRKI